MKNLSLKLDDSVYNEAEEILGQLQKPRNRYINEAINFYNKLQQKQILEEKLKKESSLVREDSMAVLKEFENIDYAD